MLLRKTLSLSDVALKMEGEAGSFSGYASVFGGVDSYGDTIIKGAFESTLRQRGMPKMFYGHDWSMPVGKWLSAKEDDKGLFVKGELTPGLSLASDVHAALKHGTLDGLSIGGYVKQGDYDTTETGRVIRKWSVLVEVSPVVFPADLGAKIDGESVKGADLLEAVGCIESVRDIESFLRDAGGLSKGAAIALLARVKVVLGVEGEPDTRAIEAKTFETLSQRIKQLQTVFPT